MKAIDRLFHRLFKHSSSSLFRGSPSAMQQSIDVVLLAKESYFAAGQLTEATISRDEEHPTCLHLA